MAAQFSDLPPEIQAQLIQQMQNDPMARAANDYGQGAGFLQETSQPDSWDRMGEKNDLYSDFFRTTQSYLKDYIPDLYPEVEDPGTFQGYQSDTADLYRNNPAYTQLEQYMAEGASFDEAVQLVAKDPEYAPMLPKNDYDQPDAGAFRGSAETYVSERAREGREFDQYDAEKQAFDDYVRTRTGWDINPGVSREDFSAKLLPQTQASVGRLWERDPQNPDGATLAQQVGQQAAAKTTPLLGNSMRSKVGQATAGRMSARNPDVQRATRGNRIANDSRTAAYEAARAKKEAQQAPSKQQENLARTAAYYNMLMYGE